MTIRLNQSFQVPFQYDVLFSRGIFAVDNPLLIDTVMNCTTIQNPKVLMVVDDGLLPHYPGLLSNIESYFSNYRSKATLTRPPMLVPGGEKAKNSDKWVAEILSAVNSDGIDRHSFVIAMGGGAVLDMVGYAAGVAHRGVRHIRIPTTVLSQNDSGVGVKNAINAFGKKNFLGCFTPPSAVVNDFDFLNSLHIRDWRSGISEAVKVALIKDVDFFQFIEAHAEKLGHRDLPAMEKLIVDCAKMHMDHISSGDPFEMGSSRPLDFGHWAAHKLEQITNYELRHGEAVAIGIVLDTIYSQLSGMIDDQSVQRVIQVFQKLGFDIFHPGLMSKTNDGQYAVLKGLEEFREHLGGKLTIMLLSEIGKGVEVHEMEHEKILSAIEMMKAVSMTVNK